jgi:hypothetical protein
MNAGRVDAQLQRLRVVAVDAGNRVRHQLDRIGKRQLVDFLEARGDVAVPGLLVGNVKRPLSSSVK